MRLLSICIPTYNRYPYLNELVIELLNQIEQNQLASMVEIIISDNGSTDESHILFAKYAAHELIKVICLTQNEGADYNFYNVAMHASGEYIWWFCSDDLPMNGALKQLIAIITASKKGIYFLGHNLFSKDMSHDLGLHPYLHNFTQETYHGQDGVAEFGYMLGYIGALIIKRELFLMLQNPLQFRGGAYVHVAWVMDLMVNHNSSLQLLSGGYIKHRVGNDSFLHNKNYFNRAMIDVKGYKDIGQHYLDNKHFRIFYANVFKYHIKGRFISIAISSWHNYFKVICAYFKHFLSCGILDIKFLFKVVLSFPRIFRKPKV